ncbi:MAG: M14 family metallopeptidase [Gemmatimonadota bacterium]
MMAFFCVLAGAVLASPAVAQDASLSTAPERTDFRETTRYADVVAFVERAAAASPVVHVDTFGYTLEGRALPLAIVARGLTAWTPEAVRASGKTVVYLQGNIHAGEVEGKESLLMLLREFAQGEHGALLDSLVLLVAPIYNADGNERVLLTNRGRQHGPIGGMGQRPNAQGYDLNRDHIKLDSPEARSLVQMMSQYDPHVSVDLHTTNGTLHAYYLTYSPPLHPNTPQQIISLLREDWLPTMTRAISAKYDWDYYYYGNLQGQGDERGWYTFDYRPRFNNNYVGLRNRIAILSEAYSYATFEDRITATSRFVDEILTYAHANASRIRSIVAQAQATPVIGERLSVRSDYERAPQLASILMGDVVEERNPYTGETILRRLDVRTPTPMPEYGTFRGIETEVAPESYILLDPSEAVLANLSAHGVRMESVDAALTVSGQVFRVDSSSIAPREFQGHQERTVFGAWQDGTIIVPAGAMTVSMQQPLARLLFTLLEPRSADGLTNWNYFDESIEAGQGVPVVRVLR